jgi:hypothetical protein
VVTAVVITKVVVVISTVSRPIAVPAATTAAIVPGSTTASRGTRTACPDTRRSVGPTVPGRATAPAGAGAVRTTCRS